jgi:hypothetical protein
MEVDRFHELNAFIAVVEAAVLQLPRIEPAIHSRQSVRLSARSRGTSAWCYLTEVRAA